MESSLTPRKLNFRPRGERDAQPPNPRFRVVWRYATELFPLFTPLLLSFSSCDSLNVGVIIGEAAVPDDTLRTMN